MKLRGPPITSGTIEDILSLEELKTFMAIVFEKFKNEYQEFNENYDDFSIKFNRKQREINTLNYEISENEKFILEKENKIKGVNFL